MGLFSDMKENQGIHISTNNAPIDIIVREICGRQYKREADLEIRGISNLTRLHLSYNQGLRRLTGEVYVGIRDCRVKGRKVPMHFSTHFPMEKRLYEQ